MSTCVKVYYIHLIKKTINPLANCNEINMLLYGHFASRNTKLLILLSGE